MIQHPPGYVDTDNIIIFLLYFLHLKIYHTFLETGICYHYIAITLDSIQCLCLSLMLRPKASQPVCPGIKHPSGAPTRYLLLFDNYSSVFVRRLLWQEDGSVFCICCWHSPAQSFLGLSPFGLMTIYYRLRFETSRSSPPTTRRVTVEVFDPASTQVYLTYVILWRLVQLPRLPLWSSSQSSWLEIQRSRIQFLALPDFLRSSGSGMESI
jgi:hypothetical protein